MGRTHMRVDRRNKDVARTTEVAGGTETNPLLPLTPFISTATAQFLEGLVLFAIVYWFSRKPRPRLAVGSVFLIFYGLFRFVIEFVRQPDDHIKTLVFGWMTRGQLLSLPMIAVGIGVLCWVYMAHAKTQKK